MRRIIGKQNIPPRIHIKILMMVMTYGCWDFMHYFCISKFKDNLYSPFRWYKMGAMVPHKIAASQELKRKALFRSTKYDIKNEEENNHF